MKKIDDFKKSLTDQDVLIIPPEQDHFYQCCCGCGLWHRVEIGRRSNGDVTFRFDVLGKDSPEVADDFEIETLLEKSSIPLNSLEI